METMSLEKTKTEWKTCFPLREPFNRTGGIQSLEDRAVFGGQVYVSSKDFSLYEMPQYWKDTIMMIYTCCALEIIYILGRNSNLDVQKET